MRLVGTVRKPCGGRAEQQEPEGVFRGTPRSGSTVKRAAGASSPGAPGGGAVASWLGGMEECLHPAAGPWLTAVFWGRLGFWGGLAGCAVAGWPPVRAAEQGDSGGDEQGADEEGVHEDADGYVRLWDLATRQAIGAPLQAVTSGGVNAVTFSPDGQLLAVACNDGYARLWNPATGQIVGAAPTAPCGCGKCRFSPTRTQHSVPMSDSGQDLAVRAEGHAGHTAPWACTGPPTKADWAHYAPGEPQPSACR